eukprot:5314221-Amphidinium_carterae.1
MIPFTPRRHHDDLCERNWDHDGQRIRSMLEFLTIKLEYTPYLLQWDDVKTKETVLAAALSSDMSLLQPRLNLSTQIPFYL